MRSDEKVGSDEIRALVVAAFDAALMRESVFLNPSLVFSGAAITGVVSLTLYGRQDQEIKVPIKGEVPEYFEPHAQTDGEEPIEVALVVEKRKPGRPRKIGGMDDYGSGPTLGR